METSLPPTAAVLTSDDTTDDGVCVTVMVAGVGGSDCEDIVGEAFTMFVTLTVFKTWSVTVVWAVSAAAFEADLSDDEIDLEIDFSIPDTLANHNNFKQPCLTHWTAAWS